MLSTAAQE